MLDAQLFLQPQVVPYTEQNVCKKRTQRGRSSMVRPTTFIITRRQGENLPLSHSPQAVPTRPSGKGRLEAGYNIRRWRRYTQCLITTAVGQTVYTVSHYNSCRPDGIHSVSLQQLQARRYTQCLITTAVGQTVHTVSHYNSCRPHGIHSISLQQL
jgi:hypothetical protein